MSVGERHVLLGLAPARARWFADLARWTTSGVVAAEFIKTSSVEEVLARLRSGRRYSALLVDAAAHGWDRDTLVTAATHDCAVVAVEDGSPGGRRTPPGVDAVLPAGFDRDDLVATLREVARPVPRADLVEDLAVPGTTPWGPAGRVQTADWRGQLVAVTGPGGTGRSTLAMGLAAGLAADPRDRGLVVLADLALEAHQGLLHDAGDVVPGILELVDAHRRGTLEPAAVRQLCFEVPGGGYDLLLGLRRHRDWPALRPHAVAAALEGLRATYRAVVADVDADVEGEAETGLVELEERNQLARAGLKQADLVLLVGRSGLTGLHAQLQGLADVVRFGVEPQRILPVVNRAPRSARRRAAITAAFHELARDSLGASSPAGGPIFVAERRGLDDVLADGGPVPGQIATTLGRAARGLLDRMPASPAAGTADRRAAPDVVALAPGSVGTWTESTGEEEW